MRDDEGWRKFDWPRKVEMSGMESREGIEANKSADENADEEAEAEGAEDDGGKRYDGGDNVDKDLLPDTIPPGAVVELDDGVEGRREAC